MSLKRWLVVALVLAGGAALAGSPGSGGFSHEVWTEVLEKYVDDLGLVDYTGLSADRGGLDLYIEAIGRVSPESHPDRFPARENRLAYWINAYNALVFHGVLARGPEEESVWSGMVSGLGFFGLRKYTLGGQVLNLKTLEDDLIREPFMDPRIHAALNCASIGCPRLLRRAFEPATLDADLDAAMAEFVAADLNVAVDHEKRTVTLSKIFDWFESDFVRYEAEVENNWGGTVVDYINRFRGPDAAVPVDYRLKFSKYDKRINKQK